MIRTATDDTLRDIYSEGKPVFIYLHNGEDAAKPVTDAVAKLEKKYNDALLVVSVDVRHNPTTAAKYTALELPAIVTIEQKSFGIREKSSAGAVRPSDVRDHAAYLLGQGDDPAEKAARKAQKQAAKPGGASSDDVNDKTFRRQVLKSKQPVLVDFWAPWCGPCRQVSPMLEALGKDYRGKVRVVKVNVDDNPKLSRQYNVSSIPTMILFEGGQPVERTVGAQPRRVIEGMIKSVLVE